MAWKLKKSKAGDDAAENGQNASATSVSVSNEPIEASWLPQATSASEPTHVATPDFEQDDFFATRVAEADDAVASLNGLHGETASAGTSAAAEDDWTMDAFAPYKPPETISFDKADLEPGEHETAFTPVSDTDFETLNLDTTPLTESAGMTGATQTFDFHPETAEPESLTLDDAEWDLSDSAAGNVVDLTDLAEPLLEPFPETPVVEPTRNGRSKPVEPIDITDDFDDNRTLPQVSVTPPPPIAAAPIEMPPAPVAAAPVEPAPAPVMPTPAATPVTASVPTLVVRLGPFSANYELSTDDMTIGRPDPNTGAVPDITLELDDAVSRKHAHIFRQGDQFYVEDLGSTNGSFLNGQQLPANTPAQLKPGDVMRVGERTEITFNR
jgi:hypothetical protein